MPPTSVTTPGLEAPATPFLYTVALLSCLYAAAQAPESFRGVTTQAARENPQYLRVLAGLRA